MKFKALLIVLALCVVFAEENAAPPSFNEEAAKECWVYCLASYCPENLIKTWKAAKMSELYPEVNTIRSVYNEEDNTLAYVSYNPKTNAIFVVFRGTEPTSVTNWASNLDFLKTKYENCDECEVHNGFYQNYQNLRGKLLEHLRELRKLYPTAFVRVTGHSLGGALALLAALDIKKNVCDIDALYTFGQPRVGNDKFVEYANKQLKNKLSARVTNGRDPVTRVPLRGMGFVHHDTEVFYDKGKFKVCSPGEDEKCSIKFLISLDVQAHFNYMGYNYLTYTKNKCGAKRRRFLKKNKGPKRLVLD